MKQTILYQNQYHLAYAAYGDPDGYPILAQHGLIASIEDGDLFERLTLNKRRVICIARPGYGASSPYLMRSFAEWAEIVKPLIEALNLTHFDILGMSSGAPYGYALGYGFPERVRQIYIFSGMPALYDEIALSQWPYSPIKNQNMAELEELARQLFFQNLSEADLKQIDIRDSLMNNGFGVAQDLRLRGMDWGFKLSDVKAKVYMRHSKEDDSVPFLSAVRTAELLPNCALELTETGAHFSKEALDAFIKNTILLH